MPELRLEIADADAMEALGRRLGALLRRGDLVVLSGELGAGKTTLTRGIGEGMRVRGPITSPTFVLSRVHPPVEAGRDVPLIHVDAYRLGDARELDDLDLDFEGAAVVVEWGDGLLDGVAESWLRVRIERSRSLSGRSDRPLSVGGGEAAGVGELGLRGEGELAGDGEAGSECGPAGEGEPAGDGEPGRGGESGSEADRADGAEAGDEDGPRQVAVEGFGPRWDSAALEALA